MSINQIGDDGRGATCGKLKCSETVINCGRLVPLVDAFSPLATSFEAPILAGETLYPSVEHHVAAQLLRDVQRLDALRHVPLQLSRGQLHRYLRESLSGVPMAEIENWRRNRMYNALKAATELKFAQYPEMKALLLQTDDALLLDVADGNENSQCGLDLDWSIGMRLDDLVQWMQSESISPVALAFFTMHTGCKPGVLGSNTTGRLLMEFRHHVMDIKHGLNGTDTLSCPVCTHANFESFSLGSNEIVILAGPTNPLSFDYPATFVINNACYFNVEHFVKAKMMEEFGYKQLVNGWLIDLDQRKPSFFKKMIDLLWDNRRTGDEPQDDDGEYRSRPSTAVLRRWMCGRALELYDTALVAKFSQNSHLLRALLVTGNSLLVELRFGIGKGDRAKLEEFEYASLRSSSASGQADPPAFVKWVEKWRMNASTLYNLFRSSYAAGTFPAASFYPDLGKNRLGTLLMDVREKFKTGGVTVTSIPISVPSLHQFFADFLLQLLDVGSGRAPKLKAHLQRVNSFIVKAAVEESASPISVDGRCNPLSIFYLAPFTVEGLCFPTLEHYRWWKFFEHEARYLQCVPGFWDYTDGRQLRAVCEQWTNESLGLNGGAVLERYKMDTEFDVLRNGALCKHSQNPHILPMLFDGVSYGSIVAGETEGDATFGVGVTVGKMRKLIERWKISPENLTLWWTSLKCVKPMGVGDNLYGLALMSARDEIFALYCERAAANISMAPSVKSFNEVTSEENCFINDVNLERLFVFAIDHPALGLSSPVSIGERHHASIIHCLVHECYVSIGGTADDVSILGHESIWKTLVDARELARSRGWTSAYDDWFASTAPARTLKRAAEKKAADDPTFRNFLMATENAFLTAVLNVDDIDVENGTCDNGKWKLLSVGLTEDDLGDFLRDLRPSSTLTFQFWTRCVAASPGRLGANLWAACLMAVRKSLAVESDVVDLDEGCFWTLDSIPEKSRTAKRSIKRRGQTTSDKIDPRPSHGGQWNEPSNLIDEDSTREEAIVTLAPASEVVLKRKESRNEDKMMANLQPMLDALRRSPLFERVVSSGQTNEELKGLGTRLGKQILSSFGCVPDLSTLSDEDMYNLGRIVSCQMNGSQ